MLFRSAYFCAQELRLIATHLCSNSKIASGVWYNALESQAVFQLYRRIDDSCRKSHIQDLNAYTYMLQCLDTGGFLPNAPPELDLLPHTSFEDGFPLSWSERGRRRRSRSLRGTA